MDYSDYISENLDNSIKYSEYLAEEVDKNLSFANYIAQQIDECLGIELYQNKIKQKERQIKIDELLD